ncbi:MAG: LLM class flavin-dependent oxidoreductase [Thermomicrobiales bacterium]
MALKDLARPQFGYCLPIFANPTAGLFRTPNYDKVDARTTLDLGIHAEAVGFDSLWVADHLMLGRDEAILEGWTMLSALAGTTSTARLGMIHQAHYFRAPALAAKMAATLDQLSGGRLIMFYDFGRQAREHHAYQLPYPDDADVRVRETVDGISLVRDLWAAGAMPLTATYGAYGVTDATSTPAPMQSEVPVWFGETESGLLDACARFGHGWNTTPCGLAELGRRLDLLRAACDRAGRDFHEIEVSVEMQVLIAESDEAVRATLRSLLAKAASETPDPERIDPALQAFADGTLEAPPASFTESTLVGTPEQVRAQVQAYVDAGTDHFLLWFLDAPDRMGMDLAAQEIFPAFT